ncbi:staphylococcal nuclease domain-containing protein 1 [Pyrus ussuriensis x Pyrus communis]|uniref:Staphylococcal nuclease domain-containing protein 1 n=1 Tax=Pyrus ussuriensis x Pyrus communis TaxID=2448454 RepID=A0A5N5H687_9ROSA|nr:staphylococcal nuclease domain-containing protein 1 [Pyrus ussuriensis x Pyrus communis]
MEQAGPQVHGHHHHGQRQGGRPRHPLPDPPRGRVAEAPVQPSPVVAAFSSRGPDSVTAADPFALEAKHFTEIRVLHRDVRIVLEGNDKFSNLIGSVYYPDGDSAKDLALELVENGYAKYVEWGGRLCTLEFWQVLLC